MTWVDAPNIIFQVFDEHVLPKGGRNPTIGFEMLFGHPQLGAVFATTNDSPLTRPEKRFSMDDVTDAFSYKLISPPCLIQYFEEREDWDADMLNVSAGLDVLSIVALIYNKLNGARISLQIAKESILGWKWSRAIAEQFDYNQHGFNFRWVNNCSTEVSFACILACESGSVDLLPKSLEKVMAISSGNSLYVAEKLLLDPCEEPGEVAIERIVGNLGRPGIILMIPPDQPRVRKLEEGTWHLINHTEFDGTPDDLFQQLTLHLSISEWQQAVDVSAVGSRDTEVCFVNGFVALHDHGKWVADLDILGMLLRQEWTPLNSVPCFCASKSMNIPSFPWSLSCIDKWEELIECPANASIVRARNNWQARLALAVLSVQLGHKTYIVSPDHCWKCCIDAVAILPPHPFQIVGQIHREACELDIGDEQKSEVCSSPRTHNDDLEDKSFPESMQMGDDTPEDQESDLGGWSTCSSVLKLPGNDNSDRKNKSLLCDVYIW